jgi:acyl-CoA dehydrogenase
MTQKAAGADATGMQTRAVKDGNENYVLNGEKWFSSAASVADIALVMAMTDPDAPRHQRYSTFIVELPNPGYKIVRDIETMAVHGPLTEILGGGHSEVEIKDLVVPAEDLLGGEGNGFNMGQHRLAYGRLRHGMHNVSMAQRALDLATAHVIQRETFGKPIWKHQSIGNYLAEMATKLTAARQLTRFAAEKYESGERCDMEAGMAKLFASEVAMEIALNAVRIHGGYGYSTEYDVERYFRDAPLMIVGEGTNEIQKNVIAAQLIARGGL